MAPRDLGLHLLALAGQEIAGFVDQLGIVLGADLAGARARAALDLVEQARPRAAFEHRVRAGAQQERALQRVDGAADRAGRSERSVIFALARARAAMLEDAGRGVVGGQHDVGERLVVPHQHVKARPQALDQIGFKQQRFGFGAGHHEFHRRGLAHHAADAVGVETALRVVGDALLQAARLADIEHVAGRVHHAVDAGRIGQALDELLDDVGAALAVGVPDRGVPLDLGEGNFGTMTGSTISAAASSSSTSWPGM